MRSSYHPFVLKGFCFGCYDYGCITAFDLVGEQMGMWSLLLFDWI